MVKLNIIFSFIFLFVSCGPKKLNLARKSQIMCFAGESRSIIYGSNDIINISAAQSSVVEIGKSVAAIVNKKRIFEDQYNEDADYMIFKGKRLAHNYRMCDESLNSLRAGANCAAFLIAPDLLLTAGHCVEFGKKSCQQQRYLFDFDNTIFTDELFEDARIDKDNIYHCKEIIKMSNDSDGDYAIIKLDRVVLNRTPLPLLDPKELAYGDFISTIGFPQGRTMQVSKSGKYYKTSKDDNWLLGQLDTFAGNSGGPVIDDLSMRIVGIHTHGLKNGLVLNKELGCYSYSKKCRNPRDCGVSKAFNIAKIPLINSLVTESYELNRQELGCGQ